MSKKFDYANIVPPQQILSRIPEPWMRTISTPYDWFPFLEDLDAEIAEIVPDYKLLQVKEKFNALKYSIECPQDAINDGRSEKAKEIISKYTRLIYIHEVRKD